MALVDRFMNRVLAFPVTERDTLVHFIFRGNASSVALAGDANNWNPKVDYLTSIEGTNLWFISRSFEADARLDYQFVLNDSDWILDPLNPHKSLGGFGYKSELRMPAYRPPEEIRENPRIPHGNLIDTTFHSNALGYSRPIKIYLPHSYHSSSDSFGVILFHDGLEYVSLAQTPHILDNLIYAGKMQPIIAVFVPPVHRQREYVGDLMHPFTSFIVDELMPWVDHQFRTRRNPRFRAVWGASNGGNISLWLGFRHPRVFGMVGAQSSYIQESLFKDFAENPGLPLKFYLDIGSYDLRVLIPPVYLFRDLLENRGYPVFFQEIHDGHNWANWRAHIGDGLKWFFPKEQP
ncbi:MAG: hypothetical protein Kow0042_31540 [Calditrichia bacterium]